MVEGQARHADRGHHGVPKDGGSLQRVDAHAGPGDGQQADAQVEGARQGENGAAPAAAEAAVGQEGDRARALGQHRTDDGDVDPQRAKSDAHGRFHRRSDHDAKRERRDRRRDREAFFELRRRAAEQHRRGIARGLVAVRQHADGVARQHPLRQPLGHASRRLHGEHRHGQPDCVAEPLGVPVGNQHGPVAERGAARHFVDATGLAGAFEQRDDRFGELEDVDRLHALPAEARQRDDRQAGQRGEERGALAARAIDERGADDGGVDIEREQALVGHALAAQISGFAPVGRRCADAGRRDLHDAPDTGHGGPAKQFERSFGVDALEAVRAARHQDANAVDDGVDARGGEPLGPRLRRYRVGEIERHLPRPAATARRLHDAVAAPAQSLCHGVADTAARAADENVHADFPWRSRQAATLAIRGARAREIGRRWRANTR